MSRAVILVLDSFGLGATPDAANYGDEGANTFGRIAAHCLQAAATDAGRHTLNLPNLSRLGLLHAAELASGEFPAGCLLPEQLTGAWGCAAELSNGKDTPSGHWEIAGVPVLFEWGYFRERTNSFPPALLDALIRRGELPGLLGNCHASGTAIIAELGEEHLQSGKPIVYTSADSVFQIACHEESFGLERLLQLCELARELVDEYHIGRVIARPFIGGTASNFKRSGNRRDYAVPPPAPTLLDKLAASGGEIISVGKIADIFAHRGITQKIKANGNDVLMDATLAAIDNAPDRSIVFTNFVDFDMLYGHRRDIAGYAGALEAFDMRLPEVESRLGQDDLLILCADHGCDPGWPGSDHTREYIPVLISGPSLTPACLGRRETFADIGQSLASWFGLPAMDYGTSIF